MSNKCRIKIILVFQYVQITNEILVTVLVIENFKGNIKKENILKYGNFIIIRQVFIPLDCV